MDQQLLEPSVSSPLAELARFTRIVWVMAMGAKAGAVPIAIANLDGVAAAQLY
jgi:hypothetical protein